ncbi:MAG TPA: hypothetical protein PLJ78_05385 [Anaerolineae bacterium]|nr:hypothetical protein [Anaerolineae bacterium]HQK13360.1 hypothetical protein [Anaerolineae bacterium]
MVRKQPSFLSAFIILVVIAGLAVWGVSALTNGDMLWFWRDFNARADWIIVYWDGTEYMLFPGDPGYDAVMDAFADAVAHWAGYEGSVGLSAESLTYYRTAERFLELHYNEPVLVHTRHLYPRARTFFVPLSGTHAQWRRVFAGLLETPRAGVLNLSEARFERLRTAVVQAIHATP